ncbi:MAG TPA: hypothetical protein VFV34_28065 [Blastocatellia bacterium]|nr:hypothetical protein [Blastocatellia bacterium]
MKSRVPWREKLERHEAKVVRIPPRMQKRYGAGTMLIPRPLDVDSLIRQVKKGQLVTQSQIRERLARDCRADVTCPITTGIFVRIAAEAAEDDRVNGARIVTPYWRVVRDDGGLMEKLPGGAKSQAARLKQEGHQLVAGAGKKPPRVKDFEKRLVKLSRAKS